MRANHCGPQSAEVLEKRQYFDMPVWTGAQSCEPGVPVHYPGTVRSLIKCDICDYSGLDSEVTYTLCVVHQLIFSKESRK